MARHRLSELAEDDMLDIFLFGATQFGRNQALAYQIELENCFAMLADHPRIGRSARALGYGIRRHEHASHVVLYREDEFGILILAVVHGRNLRRLQL